MSRAAICAYQTADSERADELREKVRAIWSQAWSANYAVLEFLQGTGLTRFSPVKPQQWMVASFEHHTGPHGPMSLLLGDLPGVEQVELDSPRDVGDAGLAGFSGGEVAGFLGFPRAGAARAAAGGEAGHEDLEQERGERVILLVRGKKPRRCPSRQPGRAGS
jgi:hypothetical protein